MQWQRKATICRGKVEKGLDLNRDAPAWQCVDWPRSGKAVLSSSPDENREEEHGIGQEKLSA